MDKVLENCFSKTGYQLALSQLAGLSEADLTEQLGLIQAAVTGRKSGEVPLTAPDRLHGPDALDLNAVAPLTPEQMVQRAVEIAQVLGKRAIRTSQGATWIHLANDFQRGYYHLQPLGYGLYSGVSGVALFLAALYKITADAQYSQLALAALQPLQQMLHAQAGSSVFKHIGGVSELGSVIYTLVRIGQFLNEPTLWDAKHAHRAASFLTSDRIMEDRALDVIAGTAGAILGLLALYEVDPRTSVLEQALLCAQHLLASRVTSEVEYRAWPTMNGEPLTGFSHGAAGIAYALLRLYQVSGETALRDTAQEAIAYERSLFDVKAGNWPDLRFSTVEEPSCLTNWCHGAPGIGLARLGGLPVLDTDEIRADIAIALETTRRYGPQGVDHLCCGILGRAEFLLAASLRMSRPDLLELAKNWASWVVNRAERVGGYALGQNPQLAWAYSPGFFQGTAGIGYELLRLAHPNQLPSILLWD